MPFQHHDTILVRLNYEGRPCHIRTRKDDYASLMALISENLAVRSFGICYGSGCCGTCGVMIREIGGEMKFRLSCEVEIDAEIGDKVIFIR